MNRKRNTNRDYFRAAARLLYNALRFRCYRLQGNPLKPAIISLAVTNRCNSHCIMCNVWKRARDVPDIKSLELSGKEIIDLLSEPLFSELVELDLTGGEPHLRDDLVEIVIGISRLKKSYLPKLRSIVITSNGFLTGRIISNYRNILYALSGTNIDLVSVTSIDGLGEIHDRIRGTGGAFGLASDTISKLLELRKEYPNFIMGIKTTILPINISVLGAIPDFAITRNLFHIISPVLFAETRFRNMDKKDELRLGPVENKKLSEFYSREELRTSYFYSKLRGFLSTGRKQWTCTASYNYLFIDYDGKVYPCEMIPNPIGDLKQQDLDIIWNSPSAHSWRKKSGRLENCMMCHEPGAIRYSAFTEGFSYLKYLMGPGRYKFDETLYGEGFSKYFGYQINQ